MFLINGFPALLLFDSDAIQLFVSLELSKKFSDTPGTLEYLFYVEIVR